MKKIKKDRWEWKHVEKLAYPLCDECNVKCFEKMFYGYDIAVDGRRKDQIFICPACKSKINTIFRADEHKLRMPMLCEGTICR